MNGYFLGLLTLWMANRTTKEGFSCKGFLNMIISVCRLSGSYPNSLGEIGFGFVDVFLLRGLYLEWYIFKIVTLGMQLKFKCDIHSCIICIFYTDMCASIYISCIQHSYMCFRVFYCA